MFKKRKILDILTRHADAQEAIVITGFRRVGKTELLKHIYEGVATKNKIFLDMESPVNQRAFAEDNYDSIKAYLGRLGIDYTQRAYVFLDEIQNVRNLPSAVKYLYDHNNIKFYLTGSSSFYLKNWFSESMAGRKFLFELYPLDFKEFLWFKETQVRPDAGYDLLSALYEEYLTYGGFPGVVLARSAEEKLLRLDDILGSYFKLDVQTLANFRDNQNLKDLLFLLSSRVGSKPEISKLAESLGVSRQTVSGYLDFFEQTYLIHYLRPISGSRDVQVKHLPKIYFGDTGILNRVAQVSKGQLFENKVFNQLFIRLVYGGKSGNMKENIGYYQLKSGAEIDFIVENRTAYEVKTAGGGFDARKLERTALSLGITDCKVVSLDKADKKLEKVIYGFQI
ncbi:ATP-binding protein [Candidatus Collierbacteria bacterium]|nr:ATP-binding protein [Candidatus Collierbacteria bacterium]